MKDLNFSETLFNTKITKVNKGELLLRNGDPSDYFYYVETGCLRSYTIDLKGKEHVFQFAPEDWIISDQESMVSGQPAILNIDAVENSEIKMIKRPANPDMSDMDRASLIEMNQKFQRRIITLQKRVIQLLSFSAEDRYVEFNKMYPSLVQRLPQKMIASYLGITPEGLSRVRKNIAGKK